jgi:hypothetical protein
MTLQIVTCSLQLCVGTSFALCQTCMKICIQHGVELDGPKLGMPIWVSVNFISYMDEGMIIKPWPLVYQDRCLQQYCGKVRI